MRLFRLAFMAAFAIAAGIAQGNEISLVVPNKFADTEGQDYHRGMSNFRFQQIYSASEFSALMEGSNLLSGLRWRPDASAAPFSEYAGRFTIQASVTDVPTADMGLTFANNIVGPTTTVYDGVYDNSTQCLGPPGGPKGFDFGVVFDTPFPYDPTEGNLLLDFRFIGTYTTVGDARIDSTPETQQVRVIGGSIYSTTAAGMVGGHIAEFAVVPEASTLMLLLSTVPTAWALRRRRWPG